MDELHSIPGDAIDFSTASDSGYIAFFLLLIQLGTLISLCQIVKVKPYRAIIYAA
jgi:hypothetical protein